MRGVRVLDLSRVLAGPWATQQLADQGAEVVKVEPPGGDETRHFQPQVDGHSTYFMAMNRNKRSIVLDLTTEAGRTVARKLAVRSDVLLQNYRPGVAERLGLDWESLRVLQPRLVYVAIHAFGEEDPAWAARPGYDLVLQAMGGAMSFTGFPGQPPVRCGTPVADQLAALLAVQGALLGLLHRAETGEGQKIVVNMLQAQAAALTYHATRFHLTGTEEVQRGNAHAGLVPYDVYPCANGHLAIAVGNDAMWQRLRAALHLDDRPGWRTNAGRVADRSQVDQAVKSALGGLSANEAEERLACAGVPVGRVATVREALTHPVVSTLEVEHSALGTLPLPGPVLHTASTRSQHTAPPLLDEHRAELLKELGLSSQEQEQLRRQGAFG